MRHHDAPPRTRPRLDARAPLVVDTHELGRRPGSLRRLARTVPAPDDFRLELVGVPPGANIALHLRLEAVMEGVLVTGTAQVPIAGECGRCLDPFTSETTVEFQELFAYDDEEVAEETSRLDGDLLDLEPVVRDAVVLALPLTPLCRTDCPGLCATCGARLADAGPGHTHDVADPRWAALRDLTFTDSTQES